MNKLKRHPCYEPPTMDDWYDALEVDAYLATLPKECEWKQDEFPERYNSGCGVDFILQTDFKFCPYCGGKIKEIN